MATKKKAATKKAAAKKKPAKKTTKKATAKKATAKKATTKKAAPKKAAAQADTFFDVIMAEGKKTKHLTFTDSGDFIVFLTKTLSAAMDGNTKSVISEIGIPGNLDKKTDSAIQKLATRLAKAYNLSLSEG